MTRRPQLRIPDRLQCLIDSGVWPTRTGATIDQELRPLLGPEKAHILSAEDDRIILMSPPFQTIEDEIDAGNDFWTNDLTNVGEIDYAKALIIADFGLGSDSPIILYYQTAEPVVMYLKWSITDHTVAHVWVQTHDTFDRFADDMGLGAVKTEKDSRDVSNITAGFQIEQPDVFVRWNISESELQRLLGDYGCHKVSNGYFVVSCTSLGGISHELGFHFERKLFRQRLVELEFFRKAYSDAAVSYQEFQQHLEQAFGSPTTTEVGPEGFPTCTWRFSGATVLHCVQERFGFEEHVRVRRS